MELRWGEVKEGREVEVLEHCQLYNIFAMEMFSCTTFKTCKQKEMKEVPGQHNYSCNCYVQSFIIS